jgi:hypothetical protein
MPQGQRYPGAAAEASRRWQELAYKLTEDQARADGFAERLEKGDLIGALEHEAAEGHFRINRDHDIPAISRLLEDQSLKQIFLTSLAAAIREWNPPAISFAGKPDGGWDLLVTAAFRGVTVHLQIPVPPDT